MTRRTVILAGVALGVAILGTVGYALATRTGSAPDRGPVIARVDESPIYLSQAEARIAGLSTVHGDVEKTLGPEWPQRILDSLVDDVIIQTEADRMNLALPAEKVEGALAEIRNGFASPQEFEDWLDGQAMDLSELERRVRLNLLAAEVYLGVTASADVSQEEIRDYYRKHREDFVEGDRTMPLLEVRNSIQDLLEKEEKDRAFRVWLEQRQEQVDVVVVLDDWWRRLG